MGKLAAVALKIFHDKSLDNEEATWLLYQLLATRVQVSEYEEALSQHGHVIELTDAGWAIEHTVECRAQGLLNCMLHLRVFQEWEVDQLEEYENGRYRVDLTPAGTLVLHRIEG